MINLMQYLLLLMNFRFWKWRGQQDPKKILQEFSGRGTRGPDRVRDRPEKEGAGFRGILKRSAGAEGPDFILPYAAFLF